MLLVEDNPSDVFLIEEALRMYGLAVTLEICEDGEKAERWISAAGSEAPAAVILDLNLPRRSGADVLDAIRSSEHMKDTPVIIFSSSGSQRDMALEHRYRNIRYLRKSSDFDEFKKIGEVLREVLGSGTADPSQ